jgi:hypothetical protein
MTLAFTQVVSSEPTAEVSESQSITDDASDSSPPPDDAAPEPEAFDCK